jgi:hypothetical protein
MDLGDRGSGGCSVFTTDFAEIHQGFGSGEPHTQLIGRFWGLPTPFDCFPIRGCLALSVKPIAAGIDNELPGDKLLLPFNYRCHKNPSPTLPLERGGGRDSMCRRSALAANFCLSFIKNERQFKSIAAMCAGIRSFI